MPTANAADSGLAPFRQVRAAGKVPGADHTQGLMLQGWGADHEPGGSLAALQQVLGHASIVTTQRYARLTDQAVMREAQRIAGVRQ